MGDTERKSTNARGDGTPVSLPRLAVPLAPSERPGLKAAPHSKPPPDRRRWLAGAGLLLLPLSSPALWGGGADGLWSPPVALGLVLVAWLGPWAAALLAADTLLVGSLTRSSDLSPVYPLIEALVLGAEVGLGWWCYHVRARGARRLDDPRSAVVFLIAIPSAAAALSALLLATARHVLGAPALDFLSLATSLWIAQALGLLVLAPPLLSLATPALMRWGLASAPAVRRPAGRSSWPATWGETVETGGLVLAAGVVGVALALTYAQQYAVNWPLWGLLLLLIVWTSLRQGLPGGSLAAGVAALLALSAAAALHGNPIQFAPLQGHLLAQCTTALLVGASVGWIRASEDRYRRFVGHMPMVLYSARLYGRHGPEGVPDAEVTLVSPASRQILGWAPEDLLGDYRAWLAHIHPADRELMTAAVAQLCLQKQPVSCEYRLRTDRGSRIEDRGSQAERREPPLQPGARAGSERPSALAAETWLRDTLAPRHGPDGELEGWEGVVENITEQRVLASDLRRTTAMLQALVTHLPMGVFFIQGPLGQPLFVNARARQLLGQREDMAAGLTHLPRVYRLHRPDGTAYPWEELPVSKALRLGLTGMRDDIVVHRPDGRQLPLVTWAAPVDLGHRGQAGAVWVLEDLTALRQAEAAHRESEARLRATIETMAEGLLVQTAAGAVLEWNPAACSILGVPAGEMARRLGLGPLEGCLREDGTPFLADEHPDRVSLATERPVRDVVMGIPVAGERAGAAEVRWILVNTMPLPVATGRRAKGRVVTTFADVTAQRRAAEVLRQSEEKYRGLVEHLPLLVLQFDRQRRVTYLNPAAETTLGNSAGEPAAGLLESMVPTEELAGVLALFEQAEAGRSARGEFRFRAADGTERVGYALAQPPAADGAGGGVLLLVVDMTQQRRLEKELQRVQRLELVGKLAGGVVHDVNNMLTVVLTLTELARMNLPPEHPVQADLDRISLAGEQARQVMGQLLAFSKERRLPARRVDLNALVRRNLELLRGTVPRTVAVEAEVSPDEVWAVAEETQVQQVLMNLCFNARDAMPEGGRLTVETARVADGGEWARLTVSDTGHGMTEEVRARIFDLFFTTKERGSGLGLAVVKQIVEGFGGRIEVTSCPGAGTCFQVWLPWTAPPS